MKNTPVLLVAASLLLGLAPPARAATWNAKNRCGDALRTMRGWAHMVYQDKDVDPGEVEAAIRHHNDVADTYKRAMGQLAQIPQGELDRDDPELKECVDTMVGWENYLKQLRAKVEAAQQGARTLGPFLDSVKGKEQTLFTLAAVEYEPKADVLNAAKGTEARRMLGELASVEPGCKDFSEGAMPPAKEQGVLGSVYRVGQVEMSSELKKKPAAWCYVARHRVELMTRAAANRFVFVEGYGNYRILLAEAVEKTSAEHPDLDSWIVEMLLKPDAFLAARRKAEAGFYRDAGLAQPEASDGGLREQLAALQARIDESAPDVPFPTGPHDAGLEGRARATLHSVFPDAQPRAAFMDAPGWTLEKNGLGVPLRRYRSGQIVFRRPQSKWCMQRTFNYVEEYGGGGRFLPGVGVNVLPATRFLACGK